jgi:hypothetical protein
VNRVHPFSTEADIETGAGARNRNAGLVEQVRVERVTQAGPFLQA